MKHNSYQFHYGLKDSIPIGLGYPAAFLTLGIMARGADLTTLQSVIMSFTNPTSAGQFAALGIMQAGAPFMEMTAVQPIINLHYCLMSYSLSQKLGADMPFLHRFFMSYEVTNEIFGTSVYRPGLLNPLYSYRLTYVVISGLTLDTLLGVISGELLPARLLSTLNVALYEMSLAVVIPPTKTSRILTDVILASMVSSLVFAHVPLLAGLSFGFRTILLTILIVGTTATPFPIKEENEYES